MTWNINNVAVFFRGTTITNNGEIISTGTSARLDFANAGAAMSYSGSGTLGTLAAPFAGVGVSSNSLFLITLNSPIVTMRVTQSIERPFGINVFGSAIIRVDPDLASLGFTVSRLEQHPIQAFTAATSLVLASRSRSRNACAFNLP